MKTIIAAIFALGVFAALPAYAGSAVVKPQQPKLTGTTTGTIASTAVAAEASNKANIAAGGNITGGAPVKPHR